MAKTQSTSSSSSSSSSSSTVQNIKDKTFSSIGSLIKLLPTGTVFLFQFLNPVFTNNGTCHVIHKYLTATLIGVCGISCCISTFTDSYKGSDGNTHYGIATVKGLWPSTATSGVDLSVYKLRFGDFVHAFFALIVFAVVSLLSANTVDCFYPSLESSEKVLLMVLPPVIGWMLASVMFQSMKHGYGYEYGTGTSTGTSIRQNLKKVGYGYGCGQRRRGETEQRRSRTKRENRGDRSRDGEREKGERRRRSINRAEDRSKRET